MADNKSHASFFWRNYVVAMNWQKTFRRGLYTSTHFKPLDQIGSQKSSHANTTERTKQSKNLQPHSDSNHFPEGDDIEISDEMLEFLCSRMEQKDIKCEDDDTSNGKVIESIDCSPSGAGDSENHEQMKKWSMKNALYGEDGAKDIMVLEDLMNKSFLKYYEGSEHYWPSLPIRLEISEGDQITEH